LPALGPKKARDVGRADVAELISADEAHTHASQQDAFLPAKMFNMAEVWGYRDDGTNPCRHIPEFPETGKT
jgi:hypothetical protein